MASRCSPLNAALVCKRKNVAISQDLAVKAHVVSAFNFSVNQRGKNQIGIVSAVDLFFGAVTFWVMSGCILRRCFFQVVSVTGAFKLRLI